MIHGHNRSHVSHLNTIERRVEVLMVIFFFFLRVVEGRGTVRAGVNVKCDGGVTEIMTFYYTEEE